MSVEIKVTKKASDELGIVRVSLGGDAELGYYCVYRGTKEQAIECIAHALQAMEGMAEVLGPDREPDIQPDGGKQFA